MKPVKDKIRGEENISQKIKKGRWKIRVFGIM